MNKITDFTMTGKMFLSIPLSTALKSLGWFFNVLLRDMAIEKLWSKAFSFNRLHARRDKATIIIQYNCNCVPRIGYQESFLSL